MPRLFLALTFIAVLPGAVAAQSVERRLAALDSGTVHLSFAARPGVCGHGGQGFSVSNEGEGWEAECDDQPVRVSLRVRDHRVVAIHTFVGGHWVPGSLSRDWGTVRPQEAASFFLKLAEQAVDLSGDPVLPASLADSVVIWADLLRIARSSRLPHERRRQAIFWLGQAAGSAVDGALDSIASDEHGDREVRKQAVFALSQRSSSEAIPALIRVARTSRDPELRKSALFWLGQSEDPRALDLFEEILRQ
jgi:HEAT repeats